MPQPSPAVVDTSKGSNPTCARCWDGPGNVRELKNTIEYAFAVGSGPLLRRDDLPPEMLSTSASRPRGRPPKSVDPLELVRSEKALRNTGGDVGAAAAMHGMSRATVWRKRQSQPSPPT